MRRRTPRTDRRGGQLSRWRRFWRESLTRPGRALLLGTAAAALLGVNTFHNQVHVVFAGTAGLLVAALIASVAARPRVQVAAVLPRRTAAGASLTWRVTVTAQRRADDLWVRPASLPDGVRSGDSGAAGISSLEPGATCEFHLSLSFPRRGAFELEGVQVTSTHPTGLVHNGALHSVGARVLVHPRFPRLQQLAIPLGMRLQPGGLALAHSIGDSTEFMATREFREGDPLRKLHARSWARRGEPVVRVDQEEFFARLALVVDTRGPGRRLERAASAAAALADWVVREQYLIDLVAAGPDVYFLTAGRGMAHLEQVLDILACLEPTLDDPFSRFAPEFFERLGQISTAVMVLLDWDAARAEFVERVRRRGTALRIILLGTPSTLPPAEAVVVEDREDLGVALERMP